MSFINGFKSECKCDKCEQKFIIDFSIFGSYGYDVSIDFKCKKCNEIKRLRHKGSEKEPKQKRKKIKLNKNRNLKHPNLKKRLFQEEEEDKEEKLEESIIIDKQPRKPVEEPFERPTKE